MTTFNSRTIANRIGITALAFATIRYISQAQKMALESEKTQENLRKEILLIEENKKKWDEFKNSIGETIIKIRASNIEFAKEIEWRKEAMVLIQQDINLRRMSMDEREKYIQTIVKEKKTEEDLRMATLLTNKETEEATKKTEELAKAREALALTYENITLAIQSETREMVIMNEVGETMNEQMREASMLSAEYTLKKLELQKGLTAEEIKTKEVQSALKALDEQYNSLIATTSKMPQTGTQTATSRSGKKHFFIGGQEVSQAEAAAAMNTYSSNLKSKTSSQVP